VTSLANDYESIVARGIAAFERRAHAEESAPAAPACPPRDDSDRLARRVRALTAAGWEARPLRVAQADTYDEARVADYLDALRALDQAATGGVVVLAGRPGSGKTAAAARWALGRPNAAVAARFVPPMFLRAAAFFRSSRYQRGDDDKAPMSRDEILAQRALVLDDAGAEYADGVGNYRVDLDELVDKFYSDERILVVTTNIVYASPKARDAMAARGIAVDSAAPTFADRYGERIVDRLRECGRWVSSGSASMRSKAGGPA
jgi:DNA replication protein DnaC